MKPHVLVCCNFLSIAIYLICFSNLLVDCNEQPADPFAEARYLGGIHKSTDHLISLFEYNYGIINIIKEYMKRKEPENKKFQKILDSHERIHNKSTSENFNRFDYVRNILNSFKITRMLTEDLEMYQKISKFKTETGVAHPIRMFFNMLHELRRRSFAQTNDFNNMMIGLNRLVDFYQFSYEDVASGALLPSQADETLDAYDCYLLADYSLKQRENHHANNWIKLALKLMEKNKTSMFVTKKKIMKLMADIAFYQDNLRKAIEITKHINELYPKDPMAVDEIKQYADLLNKMGTTFDKLKHEELNLTRPTENVDAQQLKYERMCREEVENTPSKTLTCRYTTSGGHPFLLIGPVKEEVLHEKPLVLKYHDFVTLNKTEFLSYLGFYNVKAVDKSEYISKIKYVANISEVDNLDFFAKAVTSLNPNNTYGNDFWQIANYGFVGHYPLHHDYFEDEEAKSGHRFASLMVFLKSPMVGGELVFPELNLKIKPERGTAIFWRNLKEEKNFEKDERLIHGECPVVEGSKWIANRWFRQYDQFLTLPCLANQ